MAKPRITFIPVNTPQEKLDRICALVQQQHEFGRRILMITPNDEASKFIDQLLWRYKEDSFIPHTIASQASKDDIVITTLVQNLNQAHVLINLSPNVPSIFNEFEEIFELQDNTHPEKARLSQQRQSFYETKMPHTV